MRFLPALEAGTRKSLLPFSDASADRLGLVVLGGDANPLDSLAQQFRADPPLAVWAACRAWTMDRFQPRTAADLAAWSLPRMPGLLHWEDRDLLVADGEAPSERFADQVAADLETTELAVQLASLHNGTDTAAGSEQVRFRGLVAQTERWLALTAVDTTPPSSCLPDWLREVTPAAGLVQQALAVLAHHTAADSRLDLEACHRCAEEGRRHWLQPGSLLASVLPQLVAKMARLAQLEQHFLATLEVEKLAAMAEFAAGAGHEINNPLAIIAGRAQLLLADEADPERRRELAVVNAQVKRAHEMIADMRLFARPPQPQRARFDLIPLLETVVAELALQGAERAIRVVRLGSDDPLELEADATQLDVALRAMGKNALELIAHGGQIQFEAHPSGREVRIRVSDDGPGITPEQRRHLFDPFYSARQAGRGLGLGLSKCWRIVTNHGGRIEVESQPGRGATFAIFLPQ